VRQFARVLLYVEAFYAYFFQLAFVVGDFQPAVFHYWLVALRNLVAAGQVGIEVVLAQRR
jgi:hypothetical protein